MAPRPTKRRSAAGRFAIDSAAITLDSPGEVALRHLALSEPGAGDVVVAVRSSGISTGTERLLFDGRMPPFPGLGYPLVPGYEAEGEVVEAGRESTLRPGDRVFVPGARCFGEVRALFGGAAERLVTPAARAVRVDPGLGETAILMALAATARHAVAGLDRDLPDLVVGHGVLGRLIARLVVAAGGPPPTVWETSAHRQGGAAGYEVLSPEDDPRRDYGCILDASGDAGVLPGLIGRLARGGEIVLAGFYAAPITFSFPPAFLKELRLRVAAEWTPDDLIAVRSLVESGDLSLDGLITHRRPAAEAAGAYRTAFEDPSCLKMILTWGASA